MFRDKGLEIAHLKRSLGELMPYSIVSIQDLHGWRFEDEIVSPPLKWRGDFAAFEREIFVPGRDCYLSGWFGGESLVVIDGKSAGQLNPVQRELWIGYLSDGKKHHIRVEAVPRGMFGGRENSTFEYARLICYDEEIRRVIDFTSAVLDLAERTEDIHLAQALIELTEEFLSGVDVPRSTREYLSASIYNGTIKEEVTKVWNPPEIPKVNGFSYPFKMDLLKRFEEYKSKVKDLKGVWPKAGKVFIFGHTHIDYAWLWPVDETKRKIRRTFSNVLKLMEKYPFLKFVQSSAQMYEDLKEEDPDLYARVVEEVRRGRWEPVGGMWVEPDTNISSPESLARQFLLGQRFFEREFGRRSEICWLPDVFGFPHTLPQILRDAGIYLFVTTKLNWNEANDFPYDLCVWRGLDGSEVIYYSFKNPEEGYNGKVNANALLSTWKNHRQKHLFPAVMLPIGYGDGGGGPSDEMCRMVMAFEDLPGVPVFNLDGVMAFLEELKRGLKGKRLPVWDGELYLELHRGTYTSQSRTKRYHRLAELALRDLEILSVLTGKNIQDEIDEKWKIVLRNEFHDILPGSSITEVHREAEKELKSVVEWAERKMKELVDEGNDIVVFNPSSIERKLRMELDEPLILKVNGEELKPQRTWNGRYFYISKGKLSPLSTTKLAAASEEMLEGSWPWDSLENEFIRVELNEDGSFNVYSKEHKRFAFRQPSKLWVYKNIPYYWDNWDVDVNYDLEGRPLQARSVETLEEGPLRKVIRAVYEYEGSMIEERFILERNSKVLRLEYDIDWHTRRVILKRVFDVNVLTRKSLFDADWGYVERSTTRNTSFEIARFEVPMHRWVSVSQNGFGVAILNDSKYGCSVNGSKLGISLIKAGIFPDFFSDEGKHEFTLGVLVHSGSVEEVIEAAMDLAENLSVFRGKIEAHFRVKIDGGKLKVSALKWGEDGIVLRLVEIAGRSGKARVKFDKAYEVVESNILEDEMKSLGILREIEFYFEPFKAYTFILKERSS